VGDDQLPAWGGGATTVEVRSSHASPASHPDAVARLIRAAARVGARG